MPQLQFDVRDAMCAAKGRDAVPRLPDPLRLDRAGDRVVRATELRLWHLALAALETGARFAREGGGIDAVRWFSEPRLLFDGRSAFQACRERAHLERALLLHGLSIGLDAAPAAVDRLAGARPGPASGGGARRQPEAHVRPRLAVVHESPARSGPALWSCSLEVEADRLRLQVFWAMVADDARAVRARVASVYGPGAARDAKVLLGFDWSEPLASALVSEVLADTLALAEADPESEFAAGLDVRVEQRFRD